MTKMKSKLIGLFLFLAASISVPIQANEMFSFDRIEFGGDYILWQPSREDMHYALSSEDGLIGDFGLANPESKVHTKYLKPHWESGYRGFIKINRFWCDVSAVVNYTFFNGHSRKRVINDEIDGVRFSTAIPDCGYDDVGENVVPIAGNEVNGRWNLRYRDLEGLLIYPLLSICDCNLEFDFFSGAKWVIIRQQRHDVLASYNNVNTPNGVTRFKRHLNVWGVGPTFGLSGTYRICDCLRSFNCMGASLLIGESRSNDKLHVINSSIEETFDKKYRNHDRCVSFVGWHLKSGLAYETCLCDMEVGIQLGWEYVHYVNAPSFAYYEQGAHGARSAPSKKDLTLQGLFAGVMIGF